ncbi:glycoside hydrolase family 35 protein [Microbacterium sp. bgisy207]|uniref:glycoside hydrolase family 35 protein n=1 Tax=Microbacterium sp. bgisy207 TaxID=3413800 RepID=UPI003EB70592
MTRFAIGENDFLLDGAPFRILAGALHYFRVHPDHWADRIRKARLMGLNTIETYVAWNAHEPQRGQWDATGWNDLGAFLDAVAAEGMYAIVRPGPYICAEWHNGGLPVWLTSTPGIGLRRSEPQYLAAVTEYLQRVYEIVTPRQIDQGGNVILVQIENEYGAYGADVAYLEELVRVTEAAGITVPLTTVDQPMPDMLRNGSLPTLHRTGSFGSKATERLATLREHQPTGPLMCSEFWDGWFDWWGGVHHTTDAAASAAELEDLLAAGASVNIYMFHGGTNFGTTNGANDKGRYAPIVTSYDYDAPLDEAGNPTEKFHAFREVIARYTEVPAELPATASAAPVFEVELAREGDWLPSALGASTDGLASFDDLAHVGPLVHYRADLPGGSGGLLTVGEVRDLAWVRVDGVEIGRLSRTLHETALRLPSGAVLEITVEDQGRVNYDIRLGEPKGLIGEVRIDGAELTGWTTQPVHLERAVATVPGGANGSAVGGRDTLRGTFDLAAAADLFVDTATWGKGFAFVNGFFLGRFWSAGPQRTLYVPGPVTRAGRNEIVVLTLDAATAATARFEASALLGPTEE